MLTAHHTVAFLVLAATFGSALFAGWTYYRRAEPRGWLTHLLALAQTLVVAQVGIGLLLLSDHRRAPELYAPAERRRRLAWFAGSTLVAGALAVRAYMTGVG